MHYFRIAFLFFYGQREYNLMINIKTQNKNKKELQSTLKKREKYENPYQVENLNLISYFKLLSTHIEFKLGYVRNHIIFFLKTI